MSTAAENVLNDAGTPDPLDFRRHRAIPDFKDGLPFTVAGGAITALLPIAGALAVTLRGLFAATGGTGSGTLTFAYRRPPTNVQTAYGISNPPNVAVVGGTEFIVTINPNGESVLAVTFTPSDTGVVTFFDQMQQ